MEENLASTEARAETRPFMLEAAGGTKSRNLCGVELFLNNDRLLHQIMSQDVMLRVMNSTAIFGDSVNVEMQSSESCDNCFDLDAELLKNQSAYNALLKSYQQLEKHCISLELSMQLNQEIFQNDKSCDNQNALKIQEYFENNDLKAQLQGMFKLDLDSLALRLLKNRDAHIDYLKYTREQADILQGIVERAKAKKSLDNALDFSYKHAKRIHELLVYVRDTCPNANKPRNRSQLMNFVSKFLRTVRFENDQIEKIMGYGDYHMGNVTISRAKSKKSSHQPKAKDTNQEKLYLLHMDLYGLMRVESFKGKNYILVIVDDYSRFTWVKILRSKDEAPDAIIKCIKNIQVRLNATIRNVRTDNGAEFVNQTLREFYENVGTSHQISVARTPKQNYVVKRGNQTLVEVARTIEYLGKLNANADIGIFVGYAPAKKAFGIYNRRTQKIMETIHVTFDELTSMASEQFSSRLGLEFMTPATSNAFVTSVEPKNYKEAMLEPSWIDAMQEEIHEFERLQVWELVPCPDHVMLIKLKWIFKFKKDECGGVLKNKARLVAKGYWKRILKKKTKTRPKTTKPNTKWKRSEKTKSFEARSQTQSPWSTKVNPGKVKVKPDKAEAEK
uniref:Integrase, catalytic region, zinc finger, CCHC-type, peptidase aspartic, catalytic n=1 Tax=Tanacetum cinerariifolium TaxID=118510 RepID=A0A6L2JQ35_TANCI|nr:integrase, catalytic region, zinc finger, CCHC-type, peptidase aspartic, catalytic [Tanacetum cinerariifolium]